MRAPTYFQRAAGVLPPLPQLVPAMSWGMAASDAVMPADARPSPRTVTTSAAARRTIAPPPAPEARQAPAREALLEAPASSPAATLKGPSVDEPARPARNSTKGELRAPASVADAPAQPLDSRREPVSQFHESDEPSPAPPRQQLHPAEGPRSRSRPVPDSAPEAIAPPQPRGRARQVAAHVAHMNAAPSAARAAEDHTPSARSFADESAPERVAPDRVLPPEADAPERRRMQPERVAKRAPASETGASAVRIGSIEVHVSRPQPPAVPPAAIAPAPAAAAPEPLARGFATSIGLRQG